MKYIALILMFIPILCCSQTRVYHGVGASVGFVVGGTTGQKPYVIPEYEANILSNQNGRIQGFILGAGAALSTHSDYSNFFLLRGGYKIGPVAAGLILNFTDNNTAAGGWANFNVSNDFKVQLTMSKGKFMSAGIIYFPKFFNRKD